MVIYKFFEILKTVTLNTLADVGIEIKTSQNKDFNYLEVQCGLNFCIYDYMPWGGGVYHLQLSLTYTPRMLILILTHN